MKVITYLFSLTEEVAILETENNHYTFQIAGQPVHRRTWLTYEEVTSILYKHGFRYGKRYGLLRDFHENAIC